MKTRSSNSVRACSRPANVASALIHVKQFPIRSLFGELLRAWASEQSSSVPLTLDSVSDFLAAAYSAGLVDAVKTKSALLMMLRFSAID